MRLLTAFVVLGFCAFAMLRGVSILRFTQTLRETGAQNTHDDVARWVGSPGLSGLALQAMLPEMKGPGDVVDARLRIEALSALLAERPLSSTDWFLLSGARLLAAKPREEILKALRMSSLTGPNEGSIKLERGVFGLLQWEILPEDVRELTIRDLAGTVIGRDVGDSEMNLIKGAISRKPAEIGSQVRRLLYSEGVSPRQLARMGLSAG